MNKLIVKKSSELSLKKTKNLLDVTRKILTTRNYLPVSTQLSIDKQLIISIINSLSVEDLEGFLCWWFPCNDKLLDYLFTRNDSADNRSDAHHSYKDDTVKDFFYSSYGGIFCFGDSAYLNWSLSQSLNLPWSLELIEKYKNRWYWCCLSANTALPWSPELIEKYKERWDWRELSTNNALPWSPELIEKYKERWDWRELSTERWDWRELSTERWDWRELSTNNALPWSLELIEKYKERWDWGRLSTNNALPWSLELIEKYKERWNWGRLSSYLSFNNALPWSPELIEKYKERWDWGRLSTNNALPWSLELIEKYKERWNWSRLIVNLNSNLSSNNALPWSPELIEKHKERWDWRELSCNNALPWSPELIEKYKERWDWRLLFSIRENWSLEFFEKYSCKLEMIDWAYISEYELCFIPNQSFFIELLEIYEDKWAWDNITIADWPLELIEKYKDRLNFWDLCHDGDVWSLEQIEKFKDKIHWDFLCGNKTVPWSLELIEKYVNDICWISPFNQREGYRQMIGEEFEQVIDRRSSVYSELSYEKSCSSKYLGDWCKNNFSIIDDGIQNLIISRFEEELEH